MKASIRSVPLPHYITQPKGKLRILSVWTAATVPGTWSCGHQVVSFSRCFLSLFVTHKKQVGSCEALLLGNNLSGEILWSALGWEYPALLSLLAVLSEYDWMRLDTVGVTTCKRCTPHWGQRAEDRVLASSNTDPLWAIFLCRADSRQHMIRSTDLWSTMCECSFFATFRGPGGAKILLSYFILSSHTDCKARGFDPIKKSGAKGL